MQSQATADSQNLLLVEMADSGIHWMEPRDLDIRHMAQTINSPGEPAISSQHGEMANVTFADGRVQIITNETLPPSLMKILRLSEQERTGQ